MKQRIPTSCFPPDPPGGVQRNTIMFQVANLMFTQTFCDFTHASTTNATNMAMVQLLPCPIKDCAGPRGFGEYAVHLAQGSWKGEKYQDDKRKELSRQTKDFGLKMSQFSGTQADPQPSAAPAPPLTSYAGRQTVVESALAILGVSGATGMIFLGLFVQRIAPATQAASPFGPLLKIVLLALVYCASGSLLSWANKAISVGAYRLDLSIVLILQNTVTFILIWLLSLVAPNIVRALRVNGWGVIIYQFVPLTMLFCTMLVTSLKAFQSASIAATVVQRNLISLVVAGAEYIFLGSVTNGPAMLSLFGIMAGAIIFGMYDMEYERSGYVWLVANIVASSAFQILNKKLVHGVDLSSFGFSFFNNLISVAMLSAWAVPSGAVVQTFELLPHVHLAALGLSCILGFSLSVSAFALSKEVSATTMMVLNNSNKLLLVLGVEVLGVGKPIGLQGWIGCILAIGFAVLYAFARMRK